MNYKVNAHLLIQIAHVIKVQFISKESTLMGTLSLRNLIFLLKKIIIYVNFVVNVHLMLFNRHFQIPYNISLEQDISDMYYPFYVRTIFIIGKQMFKAKKIFFIENYNVCINTLLFFFLVRVAPGAIIIFK